MMVACGILDISSYAPLHVTDFEVPPCKVNALRSELLFPVMYFGAFHRKVRKERKAQPQFGTRMTRIFMDNILSEKSINSTYPNEPQSTQRAQRFFKPISVSCRVEPIAHLLLR